MSARKIVIGWGLILAAVAHGVVASGIALARRARRRVDGEAGQ
jgi:hypothetical protein